MYIYIARARKPIWTLPRKPIIWNLDNGHYD